MDTTNLDNLTQEQLATLAAVELRIKEITKPLREQMEVGTHALASSVTFSLEGELTVSEDKKDVPNPQKAKPWKLVVALLNEVNMLRKSAKMAGLDLESLVNMAESVDPKLTKKSKEEVDAVCERILEGTRTDKAGKRCLSKGSSGAGAGAGVQEPPLGAPLLTGADGDSLGSPPLDLT
jgi:hypothetical protein